MVGIGGMTSVLPSLPVIVEPSADAQIEEATASAATRSPAASEPARDAQSGRKRTRPRRAVRPQANPPATRSPATSLDFLGGIGKKSAPVREMLDFT